MSERSSKRVWIRRLAPWVIVGVIVTLLLLKYSPAKIYAELLRGDVLPLVPIAAAMAITHLAALAVWDWIVLRRLSRSVTYWDIVRGRGAVSILLMLGFLFTAGSYGVWLGRKTELTPKPTAGVVIYISASELVALCLIASSSLWLSGAHLSSGADSALRIGAPIVATVLSWFGLVGPHMVHRRFREPRFLRPWATIPSRVFALTVVGRILNFGLSMLFVWLAMRAFGLDVPLHAAAAYLPFIVVVGALPVNMLGFGAVQAAWLVFEPWAPGEQILAFQFVWHLLLALMIVLRGLPFLRRVLREIEEGRARSSSSPDTTSEDGDSAASPPTATSPPA